MKATLQCVGCKETRTVQHRTAKGRTFCIKCGNLEKIVETVSEPKRHKRRLKVMPNIDDRPWDEVTKAAQEVIDKGKPVYQKFTCAGCGTRLLVDKPNIFYVEGECGKCNTITDIKKQGCDYVVLAGTVVNSFGHSNDLGKHHD